MYDSIDRTLYRFRTEPAYHWFLWGIRHLAMMPMLGLLWVTVVVSVLGDEPPAMVYLWPVTANVLIALASTAIGARGLHVHFRRQSTSVPFATALGRALTMARDDFFVPGASSHG